MKKILLQFFGLVFLFFAMWYGLSLINWKAIFNVDKVSQSIEKKLGDLYIELINKTEREINNTMVVSAIDSLFGTICINNNIDKELYKLHILQNEEVNAFALPDGHIVIYSGLITECENEQELCGVLGHELAHLEKNHIMQKLVKEIGLSTITSITTGSSGANAAKESLRMLSSTSFDRDLEREADLTSAEYLIKSNINPIPFSNFLRRLSVKTKNLPDFLNYVSTHPDSEERALYLLEFSKNKANMPDTILTLSEWNYLKEFLIDNY